MEHAIGAPVANFTDLLLDVVCMVDTGGRFVYVSAACETVFGYTQQEMIGMPMIDLVAPADRARTLAAAHNIMNGRSHIDFENRYLRKDGSIVHIMWSARWSEADQLRVAVARDITSLKQARTMQAALYAISEAAHASGDLADLFARSHAIVKELLPASGFGVALCGAAGQGLDFAYHVDDSAQPDVSLMRLLCEEAVLRAAPILLAPGAIDLLPAPLQAVADTLAGGALAAPLKTHDGLVGVIALRTGADGVPYRNEDRDLLLFVADQLAAAIGRKQLHAQLQFMAMHDELTRLPNRHLFHDRLDTALARAARQQQRLSLLFIDVNRFKLVNDRYGHACGDLLLQQVAQRIAACLRSSDTLARLGGDEFVVLLEDMALPEDAQSVLEKIHLALSAPVELGGAGLLQISVSVGVAHYPGDGNNWQTLMSHADAAMYAAKATAALGDAVT
jgi:diguanylate cyclase (GGDEF)-like protein/PAS domain S-box-containing protein